MCDEKLHSALKQFLLNAKIRSTAWITGKYTKVFVRKSLRLSCSFGGRPDSRDIINCFDIASIEVDEKMQHKGILTSLIEFAKNNLPLDINCIHIESVQNPMLAKWLKQKGWSVVSGTTEELPSFFMLKDKHFGCLAVFSRHV